MWVSNVPDLKFDVLNVPLSGSPLKRRYCTNAASTHSHAFLAQQVRTFAHVLH